MESEKQALLFDGIASQPKKKPKILSQQCLTTAMITVMREAIFGGVRMDVTCVGHYIGAVQWIPSGHHKLWLYAARNGHRLCVTCAKWVELAGIHGNNAVCRSLNRLRVTYSMTFRRSVSFIAQSTHSTNGVDVVLRNNKYVIVFIAMKCSSLNVQFVIGWFRTHTLRWVHPTDDAYEWYPSVWATGNSAPFLPPNVRFSAYSSTSVTMKRGGGGSSRDAWENDQRRGN